jgi:multidrug efflux pump subunit AcrA (membrane-fusion protein)
MNRTVRSSGFGHFLLVVLLLALVSGCQSGAQPTATPSMQPRYVPVVSVTGELVPEKWAALGHKTGGTIVEVLVEPGDTVSAGSPLVLLDTADLEFALSTAQQEVAAQEALLAQLRAGATDLVIDRADRDHAHQLAQAEIALRVSEQRLAEAQARDPADNVAAAEARIEQLQEQRTQLAAQDPAPEVTLVERAKIALDDTQDEYNKALDRPWEPQSVRDGWAKQLEQVKLNYRAAQARLDAARNAERAHALGLAVVDAQIEEAGIALGQARSAAAAYQTTLDILQRDIDAARLQVRYLNAWDNPYLDPVDENQIAQAEARLAQAQVAVAQVEQQLRDATVAAPFAGTVGAVSARVGEFAAPGQPLVTIGDLDTMRVETTDLDEIDIAQVTEGQEVTVTFDAFQDSVFKGTVTRLSPMSEPGTGGVNYTVIIELERVDPALRWGMTAFVDIETR